MSISSVFRPLVFIVAVLSAPLPAMALNLQEALEIVEELKAQGQLGEVPNGYLDVVLDRGQASEVARLVNQHRSREYKSLADQSGLTLSEVETLAGQRNVTLARSGYFIQQDGQWQTKP